LLVEGSAAGRVFLLARLDDSPHLDRQEYVASLSQLDPITHAQYLAGDGSGRQVWAMFRREWFQIMDAAPAGLQRVRSLDLAAVPGRNGGVPARRARRPS
jgi:hypothetical protein